MTFVDGILRKLPAGASAWNSAVPVAVCILLAAIWGRSLGWVLLLFVVAALIAAVRVAVHHSEVIALRVGEPFGTLVLALAVTVIETSLTGVRMPREIIHPYWRPRCRARWTTSSGLALLLFTACRQPEPPQHEYEPLAQLEQRYGRLITVSNSPTPDQNGTGDRLGLFRDNTGTVWGIPLIAGDDGSVLGCAPPLLREVAVSDTLPPDTTEIVGAANEPTGWRGGTGKLELLLRDQQGRLRWQAVAAVEIKTGPVCWSQSPPRQPLKYYRLVKADAGKAQ
jgi:hypothetical protein